MRFADLVTSGPEMPACAADDTILTRSASPGGPRPHYIIANVVINITNIALMDVWPPSRTRASRSYFFVGVFLLMKVFHLLLETQCEAFLGEVML